MSSAEGKTARQVMITVDVEALPRRAEADHVNRLIWGRCEGHQMGLHELMTAAERRSVRLTTYLDYAEHHLYGDTLLDVGREIRRRGHDLQLHLHQQCLNDSFFSERGLARVGNLNDVSVEGATALAGFLCETHARVTTSPPLGFRGGGYRFNRPMLEALRVKGVPVDSSYNYSRPSRPLDVGAHKQFRWSNGTFELPVSNIPDPSKPHQYYDYNFNISALLGKNAAECAERHRKYLESFYALYGDDAIAVLVLHSWSLLKLNEHGRYEYDGDDVLERFDAVLSGLEGYARVVTVDDALRTLEGAPDSLDPEQDLIDPRRDQQGSSPPQVASTPTSQPSTALSAPAAAPDGARCAVCSAPTTQFDDFNGTRRRCANCGALERQRVFAEVYRENGEFARKHPLNGKRVLLVAPSASEKQFLTEIGVSELVTADIRPVVKPDLLVNICHMPEVEDASFDVVIASFVLTCVHSLDAALAEFQRVLRPGGTLLTSDPTTKGRKTIEYSDEKYITSWYGKAAYDEFKVGSFRSFGDDALQLLGRFFTCEAVSRIDVANGLEVAWVASTKSGAARVGSENILESGAEFPHEKLILANCSLCGDPLAKVDSGQNCLSCGSRARVRSMVPLMPRLANLGPRADAEGKPLLVIAATTAEDKLLAPLFHQRKSASLYGSYGPQHESGVDLRDLSRYGTASFCGVFSSLVFDYFTDHEQALRECFRVIAPGGLFAAHVAPYRVLPGDEPPFAAAVIKSRPGYFDYLPPDQELVDARVGRRWLLQAIERVGFVPRLIRVEDAVPDLISEWFIGVRPAT